MKKNHQNITTINEQDLPDVSGGADFKDRAKIIELLKKKWPDRWPTKPTKPTGPTWPTGPTAKYGVVQPVRPSRGPFKK